MIMANDQVEVFDNTIEQNQTAGLSIVSYLIMDKPLKDPKYDPFCEAIYVHDNRFASNGGKPAGRLGEHAGARPWGPRCPISFTTASSTPRSRSTASCPRPWPSASSDNGKAGFANFDAMALKAAGRGTRQSARTSSATSRRTTVRCRRSQPVSIEGLK